MRHSSKGETVMQPVGPAIDKTRLKVIEEICQKDRANSIEILDRRRQQSDIVKSRAARIEELRVKSRSDASLRKELEKLEEEYPKEKAKLDDFSSRYEAASGSLKTSSALLHNCKTFLGISQ
jgi:hypothetical protein